jgi:hypothetical protein
MSVGIEFAAVVTPHAGLLAVVTLVCAILAIARKPAHPPGRSEPTAPDHGDRDAPAAVLLLCRDDHRAAAAHRMAPAQRRHHRRTGVTDAA